MNIYLAGPMRGIKDFNFPAFHAAAAKLRAEGHVVFNPAERDIEEFGREKVRSATGSGAELAENLGMTHLGLARHVFKFDTDYICTKADAVALLPGWGTSKGAIAERALAVAIGLQVIELPTEEVQT